MKPLLKLVYNISNTKQTLMLTLKSLDCRRLTLLELNYTGSLIKETSSVSRTSVDDGINLTLTYDGISFTAYTGIKEKLLHILKAHGLSVNLIIRLARAKELTSDCNLGIINRQHLVRIVESYRNRSKALCLPQLSACKYDILHCGSSKLLDLLFAKHPSHSIRYIGFA